MFVCEDSPYNSEYFTEIDSSLQILDMMVLDYFCFDLECAVIIFSPKASRQQLHFKMCAQMNASNVACLQRTPPSNPQTLTYFNLVTFSG